MAEAEGRPRGRVILAWLLASRPKTLLAAFAPVLAGTVLSWRMTGVVEWLLASCTLLSAMAIQVATNFFNDAIDFEKGTDTEERLGPERVTQAGIFSARSVLIAAGLMACIAVALSLPLVAARGWPIVAIGIPSLYFAFGYTGGPLPLAYHGLGDFFVVLFFGFIAVTGTVFVQTGEWLLEGVLLGLQIGMLSTVLIAVNNLRDVDGDGESGKRTLAVRFGRTFARVEITVLSLAPHCAGIAWWVWKGWPAASLLPLGAMLPGALVIRGVWRNEPGRIYNRFLGVSAMQLLVFTLAFAAALVFS